MKGAQGKGKLEALEEAGKGCISSTVMFSPGKDMPLKRPTHLMWSIY